MRSQILLEIQFCSVRFKVLFLTLAWTLAGWKVEQNFYTKIKLIRFSSQSSVINVEFSYLSIPPKNYKVLLHFYLCWKYIWNFTKKYLNFSRLPSHKIYLLELHHKPQDHTVCKTGSHKILPICFLNIKQIHCNDFLLLQKNWPSLILSKLNLMVFWTSLGLVWSSFIMVKYREKH